LGADPLLGIEMASTGEVACFGYNQHEAFLKAVLSTNVDIPLERQLGNSSIFLSIGDLCDKEEFYPHARTLVELGFKLCCSPGTAEYMKSKGIPCEKWEWQDYITKRPENLKFCLIFSSKRKSRKASIERTIFSLIIFNATK
jgi:carbamoyl-phosphate synthase/aspartate carbamoyltransferase